jgi:hypothetical protein
MDRKNKMVQVPHTVSVDPLQEAGNPPCAAGKQSDLTGCDENNDR